MLLWLYNSRFFISHSVPICDSRQIMWHLHYLYHKRLRFCWSSSFFEVGGFFFACIGVGERKVILFNAILLAPKCSISDIYVVQLIQFYSLCFFCMIKSMQNVKRRGESRYFFFTPVHSIVLFHKYFLPFKSLTLS